MGVAPPVVGAVSGCGGRAEARAFAAGRAGRARTCRGG
jgi:hypothetical protein